MAIVTHIEGVHPSHLFPLIPRQIYGRQDRVLCSRGRHSAVTLASHKPSRLSPLSGLHFKVITPFFSLSPFISLFSPIWTFTLSRTLRPDNYRFADPTVIGALPSVTRGRPPRSRGHYFTAGTLALLVSVKISTILHMFYSVSIKLHI